MGGGDILDIKLSISGKTQRGSKMFRKVEISFIYHLLHMAYRTSQLKLAASIIAEIIAGEKRQGLMKRLILRVRIRLVELLVGHRNITLNWRD